MNHITKDLLAWYNTNKRTLPWRTNTQPCDPYQVWLSEIMLQQTTVTAVKPYFDKFIKRWKTVSNLANADSDDIMKYWAGLGYYARARNLHKCAKIVAYEMGGIFPNTEEKLLALPGVGVYTSAAISAIAFGNRAVVVDANIERVVSRLFSITEYFPKSKPIIYDKTDSITPNKNSGDFAQAFMDLGSGICTPKNPKCNICPLEKQCLGKSIAESLPKKIPKKIKPVRKCYMYVVLNEANETLAYRRPDKGLLGGTYGIPSTDWSDAYPDNHNKAPVPLNWEKLDTPIRHTFTHFHLDMIVFMASLNQAPSGYKWICKKSIPTVFKKPVQLALNNGALHI